MIPRYPALLLCMLTAACEQSPRSSPDSAAVASLSPPAVPKSTTQEIGRDSVKSACPHTGMWAICSVENRLRQSGFVAKRVEGKPPARAGFSVTPIIYTLGSSRLEVFLYPDEAALARDIAKLDTVTVAPIGTAGSWETPPLLIRSGNLAAILLSQKPRQAERLSLALTAGAPQPGSPR
jgi:hypothetical protein